MSDKDEIKSKINLLWMQDGALAGARFDGAIDTTTDFEKGGLGLPVLSANAPDTAASRNEFGSISLLASGSADFDEPRELQRDLPARTQEGEQDEGIEPRRQAGIGRFLGHIPDWFRWHSWASIGSPGPSQSFARLRRMERMLPIGVQSFRKLRQEGRYYVDKTDHIRDLLQLGTHHFLCRGFPM